MKYRDIFLDFDDTLYDTRGNAIIALQELYRDMEFGKRLKSEEDFYEHYWKANIELWGQYGKGQITRDYLIVERFRRPLVGTTKDDGSWVTREYCLNVSDHFLELCSDKPGTVKGAHELCTYLRDKGYRLHICSNGFHEVQYKKLHACGLFDFFDKIILSEDAGANKPSRQFFDYAFSETGAELEKTVMIGDNYNSDIIGAIEYSLDTIMYNRWSVDPATLPKHPCHIVDRLEQIKDIL